MKTIDYIFLSLVTVLGLSGCDKLEPPYYTAPDIIDTAACPVPEFPELTTHTKRVLLEDYTGHTCPNCPAAGKIAHILHDQYPDQLVIMAVHVGWFARPYPAPGVDSVFYHDFRTSAGDDWNLFFKNENAGLPNGLLNRQKVDDKYVIQKDQWGGVIASTLKLEPKMDLQLIVDYNEVDRKICVHTKTWFLETLDLNLKLEAVIIEDSIIAAQKNDDPTIGTVGIIEDYVHMHVMRGAINGAWGSTIAEKGVANPSTLVKTLQSTLPAASVPKNCHIIAFISDADSKEILQVTETKLIE